MQFLIPVALGTFVLGFYVGCKCCGYAIARKLGPRDAQWLVSKMEKKNGRG